MVDLSGIDLLALLPGEYKRAASTDGGEYAGPCPACGGVDRFRIWPNTNHSHYWCRQCGMQGDAIDYVQWTEPGLSFGDARARLFGGDTIQNVLKCPASAKKAQRDIKIPVVSEKWLSVACSNSSRYVKWLEYRGIIPPVVDEFRLGLAKPPGESWSHVPPALILPVFNCKGQVITLRVRGAHGWLTPLGYKTLYMPIGVQENKPLWILENCANTLLWIENGLAGDAANLENYSWCALAPTTGAYSWSAQWPIMIAQARPSYVFVAGDADDAGRLMNDRWSDALTRLNVPHECIEVTEQLEADFISGVLT